jgi:hypothetical protein
MPQDLALMSWWKSPKHKTMSGSSRQNFDRRGWALAKTSAIVIIGSGSLATGTAYALSQFAKGPLRIAIIGRSEAKVSRIALIANARAACFGTSATFSPLGIHEFTALSFSRALRALKPKVILLAASLQSPWEAAGGQTAWTKLLAEGGFGITLPLQLALAAELSRGAGEGKAAIVNACYPDCVNVVLHRLRLRATCGLGNSAIVESFCRSQTGTKGEDVKVIGHHGHLRAWLTGEASPSQPRVWVKGRERDSRGLSPNLGSIDEELNTITSSTAARILMSLLTGEALHTSIPGVAGMPGGYPFLLKGGKFTLQLPAGVTSAEAVAHNKTGEWLDGVDLDTSVKFVGNARKSLAAANYEYAEGFDLADWQSARDEMILLSERLRRTVV